MWTFTKYQMKKIEQVAQRPPSSIKKFLTQPMALVGLVVFIALILCSIIIPHYSMDPNALDDKSRHLKYGVEGHVLGTDFMGRDIWARLWSGFNLSLKITALTVLADILIGITMGLLMGYFEGFYNVMNGFIKVISSIPSILYMVIIAMIMKPSVVSIAFGLSITGWIGMARQVAARVRVESRREFVEASKSLATPWYKILGALLMFAIPIILTQTVFTIAGAITADTALAIIGLKIIGQPSLGSILSDGTQYFTIFPHEIVSPLVIIFVTKLSIILMGNGVTEAQRRTR